MGLGAGGGRRDELPVLVPLDLRLRDSFGLAVQGQGLVLGHRHRGWVLSDMRRPRMTCKKGRYDLIKALDLAEIHCTVITFGTALCRLYQCELGSRAKSKEKKARNDCSKTSKKFQKSLLFQNKDNSRVGRHRLITNRPSSSNLASGYSVIWDPS